MVKKIVWTKEALENKFDILNYWTVRNKSNEYSRKLNKLFRETTKVIQKFPNLGRPTKRKDIKSIQSREYLVFYKESEDSIFILHLWDGRQDPAKRKY